MAPPGETTTTLTVRPVPLKSRGGGGDKLDKWTEYKPILQQLYLDDNRPLKEVMETMRKEPYNFAPTARSFKRRIADWGWRKNIQVRVGADDRAVHDAARIRYVDSSSASVVAGNAQVRLSTGQLVNVERLAEHIRRKRARVSASSKHAPQHPAPHHQPLPGPRQPPPKLPWAVRPPEALRTYEVVFVHSQSYTYGRHESLHDIRGAAALLSRDRAAAVRWGSFASGVQASLAAGDTNGALVQMRSAPAEVSAMIACQPSNILCSFYMFVLQLSSSFPAPASPSSSSSSEEDDGDARQFYALLQALFRFGTTQALGQGIVSDHPLMQVLRSLACVPVQALTEVAFRAWAVTCEAWSTLVSLGGIAGPSVPAACIRRWLNSGDKSDMMGVMFDIINENVNSCDEQYGRGDKRGISALQAKCELVAWVLSEQGVDRYTDPVLVGLYRDLLDRGAQGELRDSALDFLAKGSTNQLESYYLDPALLMRGE